MQNKRPITSGLDPSENVERWPLRNRRLNPSKSGPRAFATKSGSSAAATLPRYLPGVLDYFLLLPALLLMPIQDCALRGTAMNYFGSAPAGFLLLPYAILKIPSILGNRRERKLLIYFFLFLLYGALIGMAWLAVQPSLANDFSKYGYKSFTLALLYFTFLFPAVFPVAKSSVVRVGICGSFIIACLGVLLVDIVPFAPILYPGPFHYSLPVTTPRGFSLELSTLGSTLPATAFCLAMVLRGKLARHLVLGLALLLGFLTGSKGGFACASIALFSYILAHRGISPTFKLIFLLLLPFASFGFFSAFGDRLQQESIQYTSISTRSLYGLLSLVSLFQNPFGVGFAGFTPFFLHAGDALGKLATVLKLSGPQISEVVTYYTSGSGYNVGTKNFMGDICVAWGLPGISLITFIVFNILKRSWNNSRDGVEFTGLVFCIFSLCFYVPGLTLYILATAIGLGRNDQKRI